MGNRFSKKRSIKDELATVTDEILKLKNEIDQLHVSQHSFTKFLFLFLFVVGSGASAYSYLLIKNKLHWGLFSFLAMAIAIALFVLLKKNMAFIFNWRLAKKETKLVQSTEKKGKLIEEIKENESYKVATELLEEFGGNEDNNESMYATTPNRMNMSMAGKPKKGTFKTPVGFKPEIMQGSMPNKNNTNLRKDVHHKNNLKNFENPSLAPITPSIGFAPTNPVPSHLPTPIKSAPRPYIDAHNVSFVERIFDSIIGDGITNRYALICLFCNAHNGMALKDEFERLSYQCYNCSQFNPARSDKVRWDKCVQKTSTFSPLKLNNSATLGLRYMEEKA
uniref:Endoplasmic reticulum junction formation protein lunapark n=1 Tax=Rhabditophanes sp. KR3021 TaxID=114890 RepID=A0AC35TYL3_9BILA